MTAATILIVLALLAAAAAEYCLAEFRRFLEALR